MYTPEFSFPPLPGEFTRIIRTAVASASEGITIADMRQPNQPLIYVNPAFYKITGYSPEEVLGNNCRFLQGKETTPEAVQEIRAALRERTMCIVELVNYRKDGVPFWNRLSLVPVFNREQELTHYVGLQTDITAEKSVATARERLHAMRATMETVNDIVFNFMNMLSYFRLHLEDERGAENHLLQEYDELYERTLANLRKLNQLDEYQESSYAGVALVNIGKYNRDDKPPASS